MSTHNQNVQEINRRILEALSGRVYHLSTVDELVRDQDGPDDIAVDQDTLNKTTANGVPNHILDLKVGAVCTIMRNLNMSERLFNGTKVIIEANFPRLGLVRRPDSRDSIGTPEINFIFSFEGSGFKMSQLQVQWNVISDQ